MDRDTLEKLSVRVGIPIEYYTKGHKPVINGKRYNSFRQAYGYLHGQLRKRYPGRKIPPTS